MREDCFNLSHCTRIIVTAVSVLYWQRGRLVTSSPVMLFCKPHLSTCEARKSILAVSAVLAQSVFCTFQVLVALEADDLTESGTMTFFTCLGLFALFVVIRDL